MTPILLRVQIAKIEPFLISVINSRDGAGDFTGDKGLAAPRAFVIEQNAIGGVNAVAFAVIDGDPIGIKLCRRIRAAGIKRRRLRLGNFLDFAVKFRRRRLMKPRFTLEFYPRVLPSSFTLEF